MCLGYHEVPVEPLVPNKPAQNLITDESKRGNWESNALMIDSTVASNVSMTTADESTVLMSSAVISIISTFATLFIATVIFCLVSCLDDVFCVVFHSFITRLIYCTTVVAFFERFSFSLTTLYCVVLNSYEKPCCHFGVAKGLLFQEPDDVHLKALHGMASLTVLSLR